MKIINALSLLFLLLVYPEISHSQPVFIRGIDASALTRVLDAGGVFKSGGDTIDPLLFFREHGANYLRLRLFHNPPDGYNNLEKTLALAIRAKKLGYKILLNFHYSDTWADPSQQTKPAAWATIPYNALRDSIYSYTYKTMSAFRDSSCLPDIVQIGNEIDNGILWNDGRVGSSYNTPQQWERFTSLLIRAISAVRSVNPDEIKIMLHTSSGGDINGAHPFFVSIEAYSVPYDMIGISFYPWWNNGRLNRLPLVIANLINNYQRDVVVAETAYPFTLLWNDTTHNAVGLPSQLHSGYDATPAGQKAFIAEVKRLTGSGSPTRTRGFFYWEPDWISAPLFGSPWENLALFDFSGEALPAITVFDSSLTNIAPDPEQSALNYAISCYPNPFYHSSTIAYTLPKGGTFKLSIHDVLGREVAVLLNETVAAGSYTTVFYARALPGGVYFCSLASGGEASSCKLLFVK